MRSPGPFLVRPPAPLTTDWSAARSSVETLATLSPRTVAAGHGPPVTGAGIAEDLQRFAENFLPPSHGRYSARPAIADERGVVDIPPAVPDPLPKQLLIAGLVAGSAFLGMRALRGRRSDALKFENFVE